jgi:2-polyprenyl-3-methyl-5-hydroxy-6-metoxy-1,4-benzoquinol methylase
MRGETYGDVVNWRLLRLFAPGDAVLDIGCGTGLWADELRSRGASELTGIEIAPGAAAQASGRYDQVLRDPVEMIDLSGRAFATVIAADVLEHLVDPWEQLARWRQWVRPGGQIVVSVPNLQSVDILKRLLRGRFDYEDGGGMMDRTHLRWFTHSSMDKALRVAGWRPVAWGRPVDGRRAPVDRITGHRLAGFLQRQVQVVAVAD